MDVSSESKLKPEGNHTRNFLERWCLQIPIPPQHWRTVDKVHTAMCGFKLDELESQTFGVEWLQFIWIPIINGHSLQITMFTLWTPLCVCLYVGWCGGVDEALCRWKANVQRATSGTDFDIGHWNVAWNWRCAKSWDLWCGLWSIVKVLPWGREKEQSDPGTVWSSCDRM